MKAATIVMIFFTIILFLCVIALAFMNITSSLSVNGSMDSSKMFKKMESGKVYNKWVSLGISGLTLIVALVLTITGASTKKEAFTRIYKY